MDKIQIKRNFDLIKAMNEVVKAMNDEEAYMWWIMIVPDEASDEDLMDIADDDDLMNDTCRCFAKIIKSECGDYGWFTGEKCYGVLEDEELEDEE